MPTRRRPLPVRGVIPITGPFRLQLVTVLEDRNQLDSNHDLKVKAPTRLPLGQLARPWWLKRKDNQQY